MRIKLDSHYKRIEDSVTIYVLIDPRDGEIHYVGHSRYPQFRYSLHITPSSLRPGHRKDDWVAELRRWGLRPIAESLYTVSIHDKYWEEEEMWVRRLTLAGCDLFNGTRREQEIMLQAKEEIANVK